MKAMILAAGRGSRLKEHTCDKPKALVKVQGKEILLHQLAALKENGITDIIIVVGYKEELMREFIAKNICSGLHITIVHNKMWKKTNSAESWMLGVPYIDSSYIHLNCDIIVTPAMIKELLDCKHDNAILCNDSVTLTEGMEQVYIDPSGLILKMDNQPYYYASMKAFGVAIISKDLTDWVMYLYDIMHGKTNFDKKENFYGLLRIAVRVLDIYAVKYPGIVEINTVADLIKNNPVIRR